MPDTATAGSTRNVMSYCCGILVQDRLVMIADTRTNAGLDNISIFRNLRTLTNPGERVMAIAASPIGTQPNAKA
jgi:putative proteasome-type protease